MFFLDSSLNLTIMVAFHCCVVMILSHRQCVSFIICVFSLIKVTFRL